jgi:two-component system repressor protein LuxO
VLSATNADLPAEIAAGRFREDLLYRLNTVVIHLPPLRERRADILLLADAFLARFAAEESRSFKRFAPASVERLLASDWPGNVRELGNVIRRIVVLNDGDEVTAEMLPQRLRGDAAAIAASPSSADRTRLVPLWQEERRVIEAALAACAGNIARAAAALEISPSTIYRKREAWEERIRMAR